MTARSQSERQVPGLEPGARDQITRVLSVSCLASRLWDLPGSIAVGGAVFSEPEKPGYLTWGGDGEEGCQKAQDRCVHSGTGVCVCVCLCVHFRFLACS